MQKLLKKNIVDTGNNVLEITPPESLNDFLSRVLIPFLSIAECKKKEIESLFSYSDSEVRKNYKNLFSGMPDTLENLINQYDNWIQNPK